MLNNRGMRSRSAAGGLVYSTDTGRMCPACRAPIDACRCAAAAPVAPAGGPVRVLRQTQGRAGKAVTLVTGLPLDPTSLALLARRLRTACGSGGTVKAGVIEIQGDHVDRVANRLREEGWSVKRAG